MSVDKLPALPSPGLENHFRQSIESRFSDLPGHHLRTVLDGLGDLALILARRPLRSWFGTRDELARLLEHRWVWPEATAIIDLAIDRGLLVPTVLSDEYRPLDRGHFVWLGARRIALTEDQDGLMDYRLNGALFDMFALAPVLMTEPEQAAGIVQLMASSPGPFEDLLELAPSLAAMAVAWGAPSTPELRMFLTERALAWTQPMGADWNRDIGTALLSLECRRHEERDHLMQIAGEILNELVHTALNDPSLAQQPTILATLDTVLAMISAGASRNINAETEVMPASLRDNIELLLKALPSAHAPAVGRSLSRLLPPGHIRNQAILFAFETSLAIHRNQETSSLALMTAPFDMAVPCFTLHIERACKNPEELNFRHIAISLCDVLIQWPSCPADLFAPLIRCLDRGLDAELRIAAAVALGKHLSDVTTQSWFAELESQLMQEEQNAEVMAGDVAVLLSLGSADTRLGPAALALMADELPDRLRERLATATDAGIRLHPAHLSELLGLYSVLPDRMELNGAILNLASAVHDTEQGIHELGPFQSIRPLHPDLRTQLVDALVPLANRTDDAHVVAEASALCAGLMPGDVDVAQVLVKRRASSDDPQTKGMYDIGLGLSRVFIPEVVERLGRDAARGDEHVAAAACVALRIHVETFAQAAVLEPWLPEIRQRVDENGDHDVEALQLIARLSTLPLGV